VFQKQGLWQDVLENYYYLPRLAKGDILLQLQSRYRNARPRYAYFQEFIHIEQDWRITTLGRDLVSVFTRKNRPDDFRASGSGLWEKVEETDVPVEACDLALRISNENRFSSMTYDFMLREETWVIGEISYAFLLNSVYTETLFRQEQGAYSRVSAIPIGEMHLRALIDLAAKVP
jgi:hypothetical protein